MPLDTAGLAALLTNIEVSASGGVLSPEAAAKISEKNTKIAEALRVFILSGDVVTTVSTIVAPGQITAGAATPAGVTTGATTSPGTGTGSGSGKLT
jgi:hypothetical protein